ncbi:MAG: 7-cyano-7-deazaguanine synthase QueC [Acidobacteriota bacterium]|nr:7-cyano-7-deazaguanine synthase QueC [Acidobacteriota bacterium]
MSETAVLLSGGLDSTTALAWAVAKRSSVRALTFDYGQRHRIEIRMARRTARGAGVPLTVLKVDLAAIGGSALTDPSIPVPSVKRFAHSPAGPPPTYVPFRNGVFLALAAAWAESNGVREIVTGFNIIDSPDYPDTRPAFVRAMERAVNLGTRAAFGGPRIRILAPFIGKTKADIVRIGLRLEADYAHSVSCYRGGEAPCGTCSACLLRARAFREVGTEDPLIVRLERVRRGKK